MAAPVSDASTGCAQHFAEIQRGISGFFLELYPAIDDALRLHLCLQLCLQSPRLGRRKHLPHRSLSGNHVLRYRHLQSLFRRHKFQLQSDRQQPQLCQKGDLPAGNPGRRTGIGGIFDRDPLVSAGIGGGFAGI